MFRGLVGAAAHGSALTTGATIHTYYNSGRMKTGRLTSTGTNTTYLYNALGQRIRKTGGTPGTVVFVYDEAGHLLGEYGSTGTLVQETIWLGDTPVATLRPNGAGVDVFYVHVDHLNTPRKITQPSDNATRWRWDSDPFGTELADENPSALGAFAYNLRFPGQIYDPHAGLHQNYFRDYDPAIGKYIQSDPVGLVGGLNTFAYVGGRPLMLIDPLGLWAFGDPLPQGVVDGFTGFGDGVYSSITFGFGNLQDIRDTVGVDGGVDPCAEAYDFFDGAGNVVGGIAIGGVILNRLALATRYKSLRFLNQNRYLRIGPAATKVRGAPKVPMLRIGPSPWNIQNSAGQYSPIKAWLTHWGL